MGVPLSLLRTQVAMPDEVPHANVELSVDYGASSKLHRAVFNGVDGVMAPLSKQPDTTAVHFLARCQAETEPVPVGTVRVFFCEFPSDSGLEHASSEEDPPSLGSSLLNVPTLPLKEPLEQGVPDYDMSMARVSNGTARDGTAPKRLPVFARVSLLAVLPSYRGQTYRVHPNSNTGESSASPLKLSVALMQALENHVRKVREKVLTDLEESLKSGESKLETTDLPETSLGPTNSPEEAGLLVGPTVSPSETKMCIYVPGFAGVAGFYERLGYETTGDPYTVTGRNGVEIPMQNYVKEVS